MCNIKCPIEELRLWLTRCFVHRHGWIKLMDKGARGPEEQGFVCVNWQDCLDKAHFKESSIRNHDCDKEDWKAYQHLVLCGDCGSPRWPNEAAHECLPIFIQVRINLHVEVEYSSPSAQSHVHVRVVQVAQDGQEKEEAVGSALVQGQRGTGLVISDVRSLAGQASGSGGPSSGQAQLGLDEGQSTRPKPEPVQKSERDDVKAEHDKEYVEKN